MDEQDDNWDDYIDGALFAINTNVSTTTKCSPFFVMFGRHPRMPFEVEKFVTPLEEGDEAINNVMTELCSDNSLQAHIEKMTEIRDAVFPKIERNIDVAQQKQKQQYLKRTGGLKFTFNNGDNVLRRNMLQKTSKGHKMEDQWIGPYTVEGLDLVKGTCKLRAKDRRLLQRKINLKDLKLYREQSTSQTPSNDALLQESSAQQYPTLPQDSISAVPQNNQSGVSSVWQPTQSTQLSGAAVQQPAPTPTTSQPDVPATHRTAQSTSQPRGAGVQQPVRITTTSQPGGWATQRPTPSTSQPGGAGVQQPASMPTTSQPSGPVTQRPAPSTSQARGAGVQQPASMATTSQPGGPVTQRPAPSTSQPGGAGVQQPVRIPSTSQPGGPATQRPVTLTSQPGRAGVQQPAPTQTTSQPGGPAIERPAPSTSQPGGAGVQQPASMPTTSQPSGPVTQRPAPSTSQPGGAEVQQPVQRPVPSTYDQRGAGVAEPAPNTKESIGAAIAPPSTSSNLGEEAVRQAPLLGNLHGARDFRSLSNKLKAITEQDIIVSFNEVILGVLSSILDGTNNSWRYNVYCRKTSLEGVETIDRDDLKFNVTFGDFDENQAYAMLQLIAKHFPKLPSTCLTEVLLPEALVHLCCHRLDMTYDQAETFLSLGGEDELGDFMAHLKKKVDKKTKKKRNNFGQKRKNCAQNGEVEFIKRCKMDEQAILKMQRPKFNLEPEDSAISKTAMLTDKHIQMAQELLHRQFPHIEGLMSPSISTVQQFPVMRQEFVQVLHTGGLHWVTVSTIGCKGNNKVNLYDSLYHGISPQTEEQIASLLFVDNAEHIEVSIPPVVQQTNGTDCGVYAIAFATALCNNLDPTSLKFNRRAIRDHLWQALQCGHLSMFPFEKRRPQDQNKLVKISVYCECRMPYNPPKDKMAECTGCKKWFHKECQQIADKVFKFARFQWRCKTCSRGNLPVPPISTSS